MTFYKEVKRNHHGLNITFFKRRNLYRCKKEHDVNDVVIFYPYKKEVFMKKMLSKLQMFAISALLLGVSVPLSLTAGKTTGSPFDKIEHEIKKCCKCLSEKIEQLAPCSKPRPIYQKDIDKAYTTCVPFTITEEGYYYLAEDITFNASNFSSTCTNVQNSFIGASAIVIQGPNIDLDFCNHTLTINGPVAQGISVIAPEIGGGIGTSAAGASRVRIHGGTLQGPNSSEVNTLVAADGIFILTNGVTVSDMQFLNITGSTISSSSFFFAPSTALAVETGNVTILPLAGTPTDTYGNPGAGVLVENCTFIGNTTSIAVGSWGENLIFRNISIDRGASYQASATPPTPATTIINTAHSGVLIGLSFGTAPNILFEDVQISNMGTNGFFCTQTANANVILNKVQVANSGANGMVFAGFQNLKLIDCQVLNSGAHGVFVGANYSQNVFIENTQLENAGQEVLRIDNTENLRIDNVQITNTLAPYYIPGDSFSGVYPLVTIQDVRNGSVTNTLVTSTNGMSDGFVVNKSSNLVLDNCRVNLSTNGGLLTVPTGFNLAGGNFAVSVTNSTVAGVPGNGIVIGPDPLLLYPKNYGTVLEGNTVQNASLVGIANLPDSLNSAIYHNLAIHNTANYFGVPAGVITSTPSTSTGWYANISQ